MSQHPVASIARGMALPAIVIGIGCLGIAAYEWLANKQMETGLLSAGTGCIGAALLLYLVTGAMRQKQP